MCRAGRQPLLTNTPLATIREEQLHGAPDEEVFDTSVREGRALVTLDRSLWIVEPGRLRIHLTNDDE